MISNRLVRRAVAVGGSVALALTLTTTVGNADHANPPGPVNAQTTYDWGKPQWQDDFVGARKKIWRVRGKGNVQNQHGMLTLNTGTSGDTVATLKGRGHKYGRWEIRLRSRRYSNANTNYKVRTELIPHRNLAQNCGARNIALESYALGSNRAHLYIRNLPDLSFNAATGANLGNDRWHTFAVEVTKSHISWFVDAHVIRTERRSAARSGVPFTVRFTMVSEPGRKMNKSRMQMDWLRYFTLAKANSKSIKAPKARQRTYSKAC